MLGKNPGIKKPSLKKDAAPPRPVPSILFKKAVKLSKNGNAGCLVIPAEVIRTTGWVIGETMLKVVLFEGNILTATSGEERKEV